MTVEGISLKTVITVIAVTGLACRQLLSSFFNRNGLFDKQADSFGHRIDLFNAH